MRLAKNIAIVIVVIMTAALLTAFALADDGVTAAAAEQVVETESAESSTGMKALAVCIAIGLAAAGGRDRHGNSRRQGGRRHFAPA